MSLELSYSLVNVCNIPGPIPVLSIYINTPETNVKTTKLSSLRWKSSSKRIAWFFRIDVHVSLDFLLLISMGIHGCSWICSMDLHGFSIDVQGFSWSPDQLEGQKENRAATGALQQGPGIEGQEPHLRWDRATAIPNVVHLTFPKGREQMHSWWWIGFFAIFLVFLVDLMGFNGI